MLAIFGVTLIQVYISLQTFIKGIPKKNMKMMTRYLQYKKCCTIILPILVVAETSLNCLLVPDYKSKN